MSFLGGSECSTAGNPLTQFTKHVGNDSSLQRDRLVGRGPGEGLQEGMRSSQQYAPGQDKMMEDFLQQTGPMSPDPTEHFAMEQMRRELEGIEHANAPPRTDSPAWAAEFDRPQPAGFSSAEFAQFNQANSGDVARAVPATAAPSTGVVRQNNIPMGMRYDMRMQMQGFGMMPMYNVMNMQNRMRVPPQQQQQQQRQQDAKTKGKERVQELDDVNWDAQFEALESEGQQLVDEKANAAMEEQLNQLDRSVSSDPNLSTTIASSGTFTNIDSFSTFENIWKSIEAERLRHGRNSDLSLNASATAETATVGLDDLHAGDDVKQWEDFAQLNHPRANGVEAPALGKYLFEDNNPFMSLSDPFAAGMMIYKSHGNLTLASLAFEAAARKDLGRVDAWLYLGLAQAQNEKELAAIRALEETVRLDSNNLSALMNLAVSYTNEGYDTLAYRTLERWITAKYPSLHAKSVLSPESDLGFTDRHNFHRKITNLFIRAAQQSPSGSRIDPDVQLGLGILFYSDEEYAKAVDCFKAALSSTEYGVSNDTTQLPLLWNRLGATLANSGRSEEAITAYQHALELNPNFVRARYNLGVSCINIGCYPEAAQHMLGALGMHDVVLSQGKETVNQAIARDKANAIAAGIPVDESPGLSDADINSLLGAQVLCSNTSTNLYDTLRRVFGHMGRKDLQDRVGPGMNISAFKEEFEF